jgi:hypothetical protein
METGATPVLVRQRSRWDEAVEVGFCAVKNRAVLNLNCVAATRPDRGLSQTAALRQTDPRQNYSNRHSFFRPLQVGTTRAPEHRHADLKIPRVIPRSKFNFPTAISPVVAVRKHLGRDPLQTDVGKLTVATVPSSDAISQTGQIPSEASA